MHICNPNPSLTHTHTPYTHPETTTKNPNKCFPNNPFPKRKRTKGITTN